MAEPATTLASSMASRPEGATGVLVLADGSAIWGRGFGAVGSAVGEVCFNTAMTGYQEVMTDPSYASQVVCFTFPHIGNVGANGEDVESHDVRGSVLGAVGCVVREWPTPPSNFRSEMDFPAWLAAQGKIGLAGIDTRALTRRIRLSGAPNAVIAHDPQGRFDVAAMVAQARAWSGLEGLDLAKDVTRGASEEWQGGVWHLGRIAGPIVHHDDIRCGNMFPEVADYSPEALLFIVCRYDDQYFHELFDQGFLVY